MYLLEEDLRKAGRRGNRLRLIDGKPIEPLILRAKAGECIHVELDNRLPRKVPDLDGFNLMPMIVDQFNANQVKPSREVGLHAQLVHFDVRFSNGVNAGFNPKSTVKRNRDHEYVWYAGKVDVTQTGDLVATPVEFGATNLIPSDPIKHSNKGLVGALIIEPADATWTYPDPSTRAVADVVCASCAEGHFREFVMITQTDVNLRFPDGSAVPVIGGEPEDAEDSANNGINYRTEPMWTRVGFEPGTEFGVEGDLPGALGENDFDLSGALSIAETGPIETPIFAAPAGMPVRFRVLQPQGHARNQVISIHGHVWRRQPGNVNSPWIGSIGGHGPATHWDIIPAHGAGGAFGVEGDYLYRDRASVSFDAGTWGVFRVTP